MITIFFKKCTLLWSYLSDTLGQVTQGEQGVGMWVSCCWYRLVSTLLIPLLSQGWATILQQAPPPLPAHWLAIHTWYGWLVVV